MTTTNTTAPSAHSSPTTAAAAAGTAMALATDNDAEIIEAWLTRKAAYSRYNALPMADDVGDMTPEERTEWSIIEVAEKVIRTRLAQTPRGVAVQLWVAFQHALTSRVDDAAAQSANLSYFADDSERDWTERMTLAALRSLAAQGAVL